MSRSPLSFRRTLAAFAGAGLWLAPPAALSDTCSAPSLATLTSALVGANPSAVAVGDFNRDGIQDVAVANMGSHDVTVLVGNGSGGFSEASDSPFAADPGSAPVDIATGDLDRDGILDLVVAYGSGPQVKAFKGKGATDIGEFDTSGSAVALTAVPPLANPAARIYLADFTSDGRLDLVVLAEADQRILLYPGVGGLAFASFPSADVAPAGESPSGAAILDFDRDGRLDLAVTMRNAGLVRVYYGDGFGGLGSGPSAGVGGGPRDASAGDINRDGWPDLVTADSAGGNISVLLSSGGGTPTLIPSGGVGVGGTPIRVALVDLNHDGLLDVGALDSSGASRVVAFVGQPVAPWFSAPGAAAALAALSGDLDVARFTADGRVDFVAPLGPANQAVAVENQSGTPCARASYAGAPRFYAAGEAPMATAAGDFNEDGLKDVVVVSGGGSPAVRLLLNGNGELTPATPIGLGPIFPRSVAVADMDVDGHADVVVGRGTAGNGRVQVFLGNGMGGLSPVPPPTTFGSIASVVVGDFNGDGAPDAIGAADDTGDLYVFLGSGDGGLVPGPMPTIAVGGGPRALAAADFDADGKLDLAVALFGAAQVRVLLGVGDGTFSAGSVLSVGADPRGIAAGDLNGDGKADIVSADSFASRVSVALNDGAGGFSVVAPYVVGTNPTAVALVDLEGDPRLDIAVTMAKATGVHTLGVLRNDGFGAFVTPATEYPVRIAPQAVTAIDVDSDGRDDLAVPCRDANSVVVLVQRPPFLSTAPKVNVFDEPHGAASGDFDRDGDLDVAVANTGGNRLSILQGDGAGGLGPDEDFAIAGVEAVATGDFNGDGILDLAASARGEAPPAVAILTGTPAGSFTLQLVSLPGTIPDDLVAGDFDLDGDLDLAFCDKQLSGSVGFLRNSAGSFTPNGALPVGDSPTAIVAADFDRDGDLDLAVANDDSDDLKILTNSGGFSVTDTLTLAGDTSPVSLVAADFDGNGLVDLAAASFGANRIHVYRNTGGSYVPLPPIDAPYALQSLTAADVNRDGKPDLVALADGVIVFRGAGGMAFEAPQGLVARDKPTAAVVGDLDRDGRPDVVVVNQGSDDLTILRSNACVAQKLELTQQPAGCTLGPGPYTRELVATAYDDGGNAAACASGTVTAQFSPDGNPSGALLGGPGIAGVSFLDGVASFTNANSRFLTIDKAGRRYKLQLVAPGLPPAHTQTFTLGLEPQVFGPPSACPSSSGTWLLDGAPGSYDSYAWSLSPPGPAPTYDDQPFAFTHSVVLPNPPLSGGFSLSVTVRVDECEVTPPARSIYFGNLTTVAIDTSQVVSNQVCVDCIGDTVKAVETGGGVMASRQWGYRTTPGGTITPFPFPGEGGDTYVLKGASFPGPGNYLVVVTSTPAAGCGGPVVSDEWPVIVLASVPGGEVQHLAVSSRGGGAPTSGENLLQWVNSTGSPEQILVRWNKALTGSSDCQPPTSAAAPASGEIPLYPTFPTITSHPHTGLELDTAYCYAVFVKVAGAYSAGRTVKARPFDAGGPVKWAYATGGTAVAAPTVSVDAVVAMSNDRTVHALVRGAAGGAWPAGWTPQELVGVAHSRSPAVPFNPPIPVGHDSVLFAADDAGFLHAIDSGSGVRPWSAQSQGKPMTGAPGGIFLQYGGNRDALFVGTRDAGANNELRAVDPADGSPLDSYGPAAAPGPIGMISGSPAIDYQTRRVYFASLKRGLGHTVFCLAIAPTGSVFSLVWSRDLGDVNTSPVLRNGRVYVATALGTVYSLDAATGAMANDRVFAPGDGPVKGFLFPDRRNDDLIFATNTRVWSVSDDLASMTLNWSWNDPGANPSIVLYRPLTNLVYVGSTNGRIFELDFSGAPPAPSPTHKQIVLGDGLGKVGAPTLDTGVAPSLVLVGSESGTLYGVQVPFP